MPAEFLFVTHITDEMALNLFEMTSAGSGTSKQTLMRFLWQQGSGHDSTAVESTSATDWQWRERGSDNLFQMTLLLDSSYSQTFDFSKFTLHDIATRAGFMHRHSRHMPICLHIHASIYNSARLLLYRKKLLVRNLISQYFIFIFHESILLVTYWSVCGFCK